MNINTQFSSIWPIYRTLSDDTSPGQNGPGSDGNEGVLCVLQCSSITGTSPSDCLVSYPRHTLVGGSYPSAEKQSVYSTTPSTWAKMIWVDLGFRLTLLLKYRTHSKHFFMYEKSLETYHTCFTCILAS